MRKYGVCHYVCFFFVCHAPSPERRACVRGVHSSNTHCVAVYRSISTRFAAFFSEGIALLDKNAANRVEIDL